MKIKFFIILGLFFIAVASADTIYLKNGKSVEGVITREKKGSVEAEVNGGKVLFSLNEIERVEKSSEHENEITKRNWEIERAGIEFKKAHYAEESKKASEKWEALVSEQIRRGAEKQSMEAGAKSVPFVDYEGHMLVDAVLDGKASAQFIVDTGCPSVLLAASVGQQLGIDLKKIKGVHEVMVLNGLHKVGTIMLKSVMLNEVEVKNVSAEVLLEDNPEMRNGFKDGLLGLSFLSKFNMTVDHKKNIMILKPRSGGSET